MYDAHVLQAETRKKQIYPTDAPLVRLESRQPFASGGKRDCFVHPLHPDRCLKVLRIGCGADSLRQRAGWWKALRKSVEEFDENFQDWRILHAIESQRDPELSNHLPRFYGWENTDRGWALSIELLRDADGCISRTLFQYLHDHQLTPELNVAIDQLARFWEGHTLPCRSLGVHNIIVQQQAAGRLRLVVIDGFGHTQILPLMRLSRAMSLRHTRRRIERLRREIDRTLARRTAAKAADLNPEKTDLE